MLATQNELGGFVGGNIDEYKNGWFAESLERGWEDGQMQRWLI